MGKNDKKKARRNQKDKQTSAPAHKAASQQSLSISDPAGNEVPVLKERKCAHLQKGIDLEKLSSTFGSLEDINCHDCRAVVADRRANKGKGKGKKRSGSTGTKAVWICLQCGQLYCGGIGFPTTPQTHALRHAKQAKHPMAIQFENPHLRWCFQCSTLIPVHDFEANEEKKDVLSNLVKQIKLKLVSEGPSNVDDAPTVSGSVTAEIKLKAMVPISEDRRDNYRIRGFLNLGNTCFFNSVLQNLLAMNKLRTHYSELSEIVGPLTVSLKMLFLETISEGGSRNLVNPRSLFGCIIAKSPQFRGYQQQDSHELLRCLLDGLSIEELSARKGYSSSDDQTELSNSVPTFVDAVFGGRLSSTVSCFECGHSSTVYEPFLDLSLPLPTKKPPPKKFQPVSRGKKTKLPPKRIGRSRLKATTSLDSFISNNKGGISHVESSGASEETEKAQTDDSTKVKLSEENEKKSCHDEEALDQTSSWLNYLDTDTSINATSIVSEALQCDTSVPNNESSNDWTWLDYLEPDTLLPSHDEIISNLDLIQSDAISQPNVDILCNTSENELPLQPVDDSQVILLPYGESSCSGWGGEGEVVSSTADCGTDQVEWDGFGDLFNEPEVSRGPEVKTFSTQTDDISSESDPDEVDGDSPVSIESCLSYFIKPELLSGEHAWHCENCSRILQEQKIKSKKMKKNSSSDMQVSEVVHKFHVEKLSNGCLHKDILSTTITIDETNIKAELNPVMTVTEEGKQETNDEFTGESHTSNSCGACNVTSNNGQGSSSCNNSHEPSNSIAGHVNELETSLFEADGGLNEEVDCESVKVKRNASKRMLINHAPPILTIHLKRFSQDTRGRLMKLSGHVGFKDVIDLSQYIDKRCTDDDEYKYHLLGVVEHEGTMRGGHYVAYVRVPNNSSKPGFVWYHASDAHIREVSMEEVLRSEAYILFYEKI